MSIYAFFRFPHECCISWKNVIKSRLMPTFSKYCYHELALGFMHYFRPYCLLQLTKDGYAALMGGLDKRNQVSAKGVVIFPRFLLYICDKFDLSLMTKPHLISVSRIHLNAFVQILYPYNTCMDKLDCANNYRFTTWACISITYYCLWE